MTDAKKLINWKALEDICDDDEVILEIAEAICDDTPEVMDGIIDAIKEGDADNLRFYSHRMKGATATIGAVEISALASTIETAAKAGDVDQAKPFIDELKSNVDAVLELLGQPDWLSQVKD